MERLTVWIGVSPNGPTQFSVDKGTTAEKALKDNGFGEFLNSHDLTINGKPAQKSAPLEQNHMTLVLSEMMKGN